MTVARGIGTSALAALLLLLLLLLAAGGCAAAPSREGPPHPAAAPAAAPGFSAVRWWKGDGDPLADADLRGRVTVVFAWSMRSADPAGFFDRLTRALADLEPRGVRFVGISRLERFDPSRGVVDPAMENVDELLQYDLWKEQYAVPCALAVGACGDDALLEAFGVQALPSLVVVGKDGAVADGAAGGDEAAFAVLRAAVERALAR